MFDTSQYEAITVQEIMNLPPEIIGINEPMESVMNKFESSKAWNLPVVNGDEYVGFVSNPRFSPLTGTFWWSYFGGSKAFKSTCKATIHIKKLLSYKLFTLTLQR
jgi:hypothetical protein